MIDDEKEKNTIPDQKELEREIGKYLSDKYGGQVKIISAGLFPQAGPAEDDDDGDRVEESRGPAIDFRIRPDELVAYLDEYVIGQEHAKEVLATKICTHFNRVRQAREEGEEPRGPGQVKSNVLLIGPTGVGKTYLVKLIASRIGVPFVKGDATKFSETGYVGADVEDLIRDLVREAGGDLELASYGIVYVDEIDKIASGRDFRGHDVSRTGVQRALLKPMEETDVDLKVPHDPISQLEAMEYYRTHGKRKRQTVNTRNILFIVSGAFSGLEEIVARRSSPAGIGFESDVRPRKPDPAILSRVKAEDLIEYGFESEFVGRLPVIAGGAGFFDTIFSTGLLYQYRTFRSMWLRSLIFNLLFFLDTLILSTVVLFMWPFAPMEQLRRVAPIWGGLNRWLLARICGLEDRVEGLDRLPPPPFILLANHQSAWETVVFPAIFPPFVWVLKKSLFNIPFFGWTLRITGQIGIDRRRGIEALKQVQREGKRVMDGGVSLAVFPEGTRQGPGSRIKGQFKSGGVSSLLS